MDNKCITFSIVLFTLLCRDCFSGPADIPIKIVEEPSNYGIGGPQNGNSGIGNVINVDVVAVAKPKSARGPAALVALNGRCFSKTDSQYKYELCPFHNVTQSEQSLRWNPYSGVLGVWRQWSVSNYSFSGQQYYDGDSCGTIRRSVNVYFRCGDTNAIVSVEEPSTCQYEIIFSTPNSCNTHNLLVYPTLSKDLQKRWDILQTELHIGDITDKGYAAGLNTLLEEAGYMIGDLSDDGEAESSRFESLEQCEESYQALTDEVKVLKSQIEQLRKTDDRDTYGNMYYDMDW